MEYQSTHLDYNTQQPFTSISYCPLCKFVLCQGDKAWSHWFCCQCGDGPQSFAVSAACCNCGHRRELDHPNRAEPSLCTAPQGGQTIDSRGQNDMIPIEMKADHETIGGLSPEYERLLEETSNPISIRDYSTEKKGGTSKKFACHYFRRNPEMHNRSSSCTGPGWDSVSRLKEHLYRHHTESLDDIKLEQLKSRKGLVRTSEKERWKVVYRILFPDDDSSEMPTPYYDCGAGSERSSRQPPQETNYLLEHCKHQLPRLVCIGLQNLLEKEYGKIEERFKQQIEQVVSSCCEQMALTFQQQCSPTLPINLQDSLTLHTEPSAAAVSESILGLRQTGNAFVPPPVTFDNSDVDMEGKASHDNQYVLLQQKPLGNLGPPYEFVDPTFLQIGESSNTHHFLREPDFQQEILKDISHTQNPITGMHITSTSQIISNGLGEFDAACEIPTVFTQIPREANTADVGRAIEDCSQSHYLEKTYPDMQPDTKSVHHAGKWRLSCTRPVDQYPGLSELLEVELSEAHCGNQESTGIRIT